MAKAGDRKITSFKISNEQLGVIGWTGDGGVRLASTKKAKALLEKKLRAQVAKMIGSKVIPGIGWASWAAAGIGYLNAAAGNKGFKFTLTLKYTEFFFHQQGHYVRGWDITSIKVVPYR